MLSETPLRWCGYFETEPDCMISRRQTGRLCSWRIASSQQPH